MVTRWSDVSRVMSSLLVILLQFSWSLISQPSSTLPASGEYEYGQDRLAALQSCTLTKTISFRFFPFMLVSPDWGSPPMPILTVSAGTRKQQETSLQSREKLCWLEIQTKVCEDFTITFNTLSRHNKETGDWDASAKIINQWGLRESMLIKLFWPLHMN